MDVSTFLDLLIRINGPELAFKDNAELAGRFKAWVALDDRERSFSVASMVFGTLLLATTTAQAAERIDQVQQTQGELLAAALDQLAALREDVAALRADLASSGLVGRLDALLTYLGGATDAGPVAGPVDAS